MKLYPLKFQPIFKYRIWGGDKLKTVLNKDYNEENIGESWEISDVKNDETLVANGEFTGETLRSLIKRYKGDLVGGKVYEAFGNEFPLLIKFIDAKTPLSIQVHPSNEIAKERHNSFGKNEMWYVMQADKDAELIVGFEEEIDAKAYTEHLKNNTILNVMHHEKVAKGDTFYIPTGRVHAIGAGVLLAEIQQTSDITYRIYDYDRVDAKTGQKRELHNDLAVDVIDYKVHENYRSEYNLVINQFNSLVKCPYFTTNIINVKGEMNIDYSKLDSFVIYICVEGTLKMGSNHKKYLLNSGESILIPAIIDLIKLSSHNCKVLEVFIG